MMTIVDFGAVLMNAASNLRRPDGGFTITAEGNDVTRGYALSIYPEREKKIMFATEIDLLEFMIDNNDVLALPGRTFGGWHDPLTGRIYLDVSIVVNDLEEAKAMAREYGQLVIFDFSQRASIRVTESCRL